MTTVKTKKPMQCYIYEYVDRVTNNWHSGGGVVIITTGDPVTAWRKHIDSVYRTPEYAYMDDDDLVRMQRAITHETVPDRKFLAHTKAGVFVFPDAGCC